MPKSTAARRTRGATAIAAEDVVDISHWLSKSVSKLRFAAPVTHVYNPLEYAAAPHEQYLRLYSGSPRPRRVILLGMNPGPWGMAQTGVPFGEVSLARDWLGITATVAKPAREHRKRPVQGFACARSEVSGARLWGWARDTFETPEQFFSQFFVANYCPLCFMEESGRNHTPVDLPAREQKPLFDVCDEALRRLATLLEPELVVGVGQFAEQRARLALEGTGIGIGGLLHPSPASPLANKGWAKQATAQLRAQGIKLG